MKKRNEKGFFLVETMLVISVVAVVLLIVFKLFSSVYYGFLESENYNAVNAINALSNIQKYYESIGEIDTSLLSEENTYIELTNEAMYDSPYYTRIKEEYGITDVYLIDLDYFLNSNRINDFPVLFRRYLKTLKNVEGIVIVICTKGNEFSYVKLKDSVHITLNGDEEDEYGVYVNVGGTFVDPGYTGWDGEEPQTEWENGKVLDTNTPGTYYLHYDFGGYIFRRKVEVGNYSASFSYTESEQTFKPQYDGYYKLEAWGARGQDSVSGNGSFTSGVVKLNKNDILYVYVGGNSGYNAGIFDGLSGGGATDIRLLNGNWNDFNSLNSRIMVAAGGGGHEHGAPGGTLNGINGGYHSAVGGSYAGLGATQINGGATNTNGGNAGSFGNGGSGTYYSDGHLGGGGGGGYYGGSGAKWHAGGGSGSSFISGYAGVNAITSSTDRTHTNNTLHYSNKYFMNGKMKSGVNEGNGKAKITYLGSNYPKTNAKLNNTRYIKDCVNGNSVNASNHWVELQAIYEGVNIAKGKSITGTSSENSSYPYSRITDGDITDANYAEPSSEGSSQCITIDLENTYDLDEIAVWHYYGDARSYNNHSLYVSSDNTTWTTLIDNVSGVTETSNGIRVSAYD